MLRFKHISPSKLFIGYAIIAAAGRFLDFIIACVLIMMPLPSFQALLIFQTFIGHALVVAARKCLFFVVVCVSILMLLA